MAVSPEAIRQSLLAIVTHCGWNDNRRWKIICPVDNDGRPGAVSHFSGAAEKAADAAVRMYKFRVGRDVRTPDGEPVYGSEEWGELVPCGTEEWIDYLESRICSVEDALDVE